MPRRVTRRKFLSTAVVFTGGALIAPAFCSRVLGANERLNVAGVGVGGKGESDVENCKGENVVCLCDVDDENAASSYKRFPDAKRFKDFRKMLDEEGSRIDAVTVSTPDHLHATVALAAMRLGKHVYCQKPLTRTVREARLLRETATAARVATQMGNQGHSHAFSRRLVELIRGGILGTVREVHVWTDRPIWPQGIDRPLETPPVPKHLDWDLWLGPAPVRPYNPAYVPFKWRGWWDFGTGALGDMACHNMDVAFWSLGLKDPISVSAQSSPVLAETAPSWSIVRWQFPPSGDRPALALTWYDGGKKPGADIAKGRKLDSNGYIIAGDKDTLHVPHYWGGGELFSGAKMEDFKSIPETLPRSSGGDKEESIDALHKQEWFAACRGGPKALSSFDYAGPMTEAILLGNIAVRTGKKIEWDAASFKIKNVPEANLLLSFEPRGGWRI